MTRLQRLASVTLLICSLHAVALAEEPSEVEIGQVQVLHSEQNALVEIFGEVDSLSCDTIAVSDSMRTALEAALQRGILDSVYIVYNVFANGAISGCAIVTEEKGKYRPITFMTGIDPNQNVVDVRVLVYRESRGGEVQRSRFLRQYRGKAAADPIRINRDIINITGATISVRALNAGVRKCLAVASYLDSTNSRGEKSE